MEDVDSKEARSAAHWLIQNVPVHIEGNTLFPAMHESLTELFEQRDSDKRQEFIDELSIYLMRKHGGLTASDAEMVGYFLEEKKTDENI